MPLSRPPRAVIAADAPLRYYAPSPGLRPYLTNLFCWTGRNTAVCGWMPAIEAQIIVPLGGGVRVHFADSAIFEVRAPSLVGPMAGSMHTHTTDDFVASGAGFTTAGYLALVGAPAGALVNRVTELAAIWGACAAGDLEAAVRAHAAPDARAAALDRWFMQRTADTVVDWRALALDRWITRPIVPSVALLADDVALSLRQTERLVHRLHGMSPKTFAMRQRALVAANRLAQDPDASIAAVVEGYADHSHLVRDFKRFIGSTPTRFLDTEAMRHVFEEPARAGTRLMTSRR